MFKRKNIKYIYNLLIRSILHKFNSKVILLFVFAFILLNNLDAEDLKSDSLTINKELAKTYLMFNQSMQLVTYRDFATSPLFYEGFGMELGMA